MKYAILTTKHHDGFCLWPSRHTEYCVRNSPVRDVVRPFVDVFRAARKTSGSTTRCGIASIRNTNPMRAKRNTRTIRSRSCSPATER